MRLIILLVTFFSTYLFATPPAMEIKANNPECQTELEQYESKYTDSFNTMVADVVINLHLGSLMKIRETAIKEGNREVQIQIDDMIAYELVQTIYFGQKASEFKKQLVAIKNAIELEPLLVNISIKEEVEKAFKKVGV